MYSRKSRNDLTPPAHLPEHYSGWAFRPSPPPSDRPPQDRPPIEGADPPKPSPGTRPLDPPKSPFLPRPFPPMPDFPSRPDPGFHGPGEPDSDDPGRPPLPPMHALFGEHSPFRTGTFSFEELLLIGLIFLLGGEDGDNELPLLLALLLFCG